MARHCLPAWSSVSFAPGSKAPIASFSEEIRLGRIAVPFVANPAKLEELISKAFLEPEIIQELASSDPPLPGQLRAEVRQKAPQIWAAVEDEIKEFDTLERDLNSVLLMIARTAPPAPSGYQVLHSVFSRYLPRTALSIAVLYIGASFFLGWSTLWRWAIRAPFIDILGFLAIASAVGFIVYLPMHIIHRRQRDTAQRELAVALKVEQTRAQLPQLEATILDVAYQKGVLRAVRLAINNRLGPLYSTDLTITSAPGLDSGLNASYFVTTSADSRLNFMLKHMNGGSIGIAGPRGGGKSTLIQSVCRDDLEEFDGRPALTVLTSAPVEYEARDFLLHLFASVCHRAIERGTPGYNRSEWQKYAPPQDTIARSIARLLLRIGLFLLCAGVVSLLVSLVLASMNVEVAALRKNAPSEAAHAAESTKATATRRKQTTTPENPEVQVVEFLHELGLAPPTVWNSGWALLCLGGILIIAVWVQAPRDEINPGGAKPLQTSHSAPDEAVPSRSSPFGSIRKLLTLYSTPPVVPPVPALITEAMHWLTEIKFQQSFTTGWSGSLKLALGLSGTVKRAKSLAQLQLTLPEIVDGLTRFLRDAHRTYPRILIGIDELDKLESDVKAERFLNEIKAIFGIRGVFYLISISENAMSHFERRGLPFRDAFDSSFDDVIAVEYMNFHQTRLLLADRVIGMPIQFRALCYCLSGGLARELIRACRDLVKHARDSGSVDLSSLCRALVAEELRAKIRGVSHAVERIRAEAEGNDLLRRLYALETEQVAPAPIEACAAVLLTRWREGWPEESNKIRRSRMRRINALAQEAGMYLRYLGAVLRVFNNSLDRVAFERPENLARIDIMARTLQALSVSHMLAGSMLDACMSSVGPGAGVSTDELSGG